MSCPHGNHEEACDLCEEVNAAYKQGYEAGGKHSIDLALKHLKRAETAEHQLAEARKVFALIKQALLPDPHDEREISVSWLRETIITAIRALKESGNG